MRGLHLGSLAIGVVIGILVAGYLAKRKAAGGTTSDITVKYDIEPI